MKLLNMIIILIVLFGVLSGDATAQFLNYPESVVYDSLRNRYLVSSWNTGNLVQIDSNGTQSYVFTNQGCYAGICLVGDSLFVAGKDEGVKGFDLATGEMFMNLPIPNTQLLNDIAPDTSGYLYISDPQVHKIIRVRISDQSFSTFVESGLNVPNGLVHDEENNRMILVSARNNSPIQSISLIDSSVTNVIFTFHDIYDGITRDNEGNYYISSWGSSSVYRYNPEFSGVPEVVSTHGPQPADIFFNKQDNILAVPEFYTHTVVFLPMETSGIIGGESIDERLPHNVTLLQNYPNPFNGNTIISFEVQKQGNLSVDIYDIRGRIVESVANGFYTSGIYEYQFSGDELSSGTYFVSLKSDAYRTNRKITLIK